MCAMQLSFLPNSAEEDEGLAHAGIETFRDAPYSSVARECGQNSRDASMSLPVRITFDQIEIDTSDIPDIENLKSTIQACLHRAKRTGDVKELQFFRKADQLVSAPSIKALVVSDTGTKGLIGPSKKGTPFHSLLKGAGVSNKSDETSGGSFGIGKNASFAVSDLHTVFYSTLFETDGRKKFLAQGKSILVSHETESGPWRATGYWGSPNYQPIDSMDAAPKWLHRSEIGASAVSIGFRSAPDWAARVAESLIRNFFAAIHREEMEFSVDNGRVKINKESLPSLFEDLEIRAAANRNDSASELDFARNLFDCMKSAETLVKETSIANLGDFRLQLLIEDHLPKRIGIIRNGMFITDNLQYFGDKLQRFSLYKDFVAVVEPTNDVSKKWLKLLENPRHDELSAERIQDECQREAIRKSMRQLKDWLRQTIKEHTVSESKDTTQIEEMNEFFADTTGDPAQGHPTEERDPEKIKHARKPAIEKQPPGQGRGTVGGGSRRGTGSSPGSGSHGPGVGAGTGGSGSRGSYGLVPVTDLRAIRHQLAPSRKRIIYFTPERTTSASIAIHASGMSGSTPLAIAKLDGKSLKPRHTVELTAGTRASLVVEFASDFNGPIEVYFKEISGMEETA